MKERKVKSFILIILMIFIGIFIPKGKNIIIQNKDYKNSNELENKEVSLIANVNKGELEINPIDADGNVIVTLRNSDYQGDDISLAVWSGENGIDDLNWYRADKIDKDSNSVTYTIKIKNHKSFGDYFVDAYYFDKNGSKELLVGDTFKIDLPQVDETNSGFTYNPDTDAMDIKVKFNTALNITKVTIPVWSGSNGQDDIIWYEASDSDKDGIWTVNTNISKHDYFVGDYFAHVYITTNTGMYSYAYQFIQNVPNNKFSINYNQDHSGFDINYSYLDKLKAKGYTINCAVWSNKNGIDDVVWYDMNKEKISDSFSNHIGKDGIADEGTYTADLYVYKNGKSYYMASSSFEITGIKATSVIAVQEGDKIKVSINGVSSNVKSVLVPVWTTAKGQDDIIWYKASDNNKDGNWEVVVPISNHKYSSGLYAVHVYLYYSNKTQAIYSKCNVAFSDVSVSAVPSPDEMNVRVTLNGGIYNNDKVSFAVWAAGGKVVWYNAKKDGNGVPYFDVPVTDHKKSGLYYVDAYGSSGHLTGNTFNISPVVIKRENITIDEIDLTNATGEGGIYKVSINLNDNGIDSKSGIASVQVPVWSQSNLNDVKWYDARLEGDSYVVVVDPKYHKYNNGSYHNHVYVTAKNGVTTSIAAPDENNIALDINAKVEKTERANTTVRIYNTSPSITGVSLAVWSISGGIDDVVYYKGKRQNDGSYLVVVKASNHYPFENGVSHLAYDIYVNDNYKKSEGSSLFDVRNVPFVVSDKYRYSQKDNRWANFYYGIHKFGKTGCMPTSIAMAFSTIYDSYIYPNQIANDLYNRTDTFNKIGPDKIGPGTTGFSVSAAASFYDKVTYKGLAGLGDVRRALENGQIVIGALAYTNYLPFGAPGQTHAVVMYGYDNRSNRDLTNVVDPLGFKMNGVYKVADLFAQRSWDEDDKKGGYLFHALY